MTPKPCRGEMFSEHCAPMELERVWRPKTIIIAVLWACLWPAAIANSMAVGPGRGEFTNCFAHGPPHPAPLLPPREEREFVCLATGGTVKMRPSTPGEAKRACSKGAIGVSVNT